MRSRVLTLVISAAALASAQDTRGTLLGRVVDSSGAVLPGVEVKAVNTATATTVTGRSNDAGNYTIPFVLPGTYTVSAELAGFKRFLRENVEIRINDTVSLEIALAPGQITETVEVTAAPALLETASASVGMVVDQRRVADLPTLSGNPFALIQLSPGVVNTTDLRPRLRSSPNATSQISTDGNPQYGNEFSIDGIPNVRTAPFEGSSLQVAFIPPSTAVSEFKVQSITYDASLGHTAGAVINVSTRSGTNSLRGEAYEYFRNRVLDAKDFFQNRSGQTLPVYQNNRFGFYVAGPAYVPHVYDGRNKTFWFYAQEFHKYAYPQSKTFTVPTARELSGDFSELLAIGSQYQIYDPATIRPTNAGRFTRDPLPGNRLAASRISLVAKKLGALWPEPNQPGTRDGLNNYFSGAENADDYLSQQIARVDQVFGPGHRLYLRLHHDYYRQTKNDNFQNIANRSLHNRMNHGIALDDVLVFGPSFLLNLRYGFLHFAFPEQRASRGVDLASYGFSDNFVRLTDPARVALPLINPDVYRGFGNNYDRVVSHITHSGSAGFIRIAGAHNLRFGTELRIDRPFADEFTYSASPTVQFSTNWTRGPLDNSPASPKGQGLTSFLLGLPTGGYMERTAGGYAMQQRHIALYVQDDHRLTPRLSVGFGVRYEYETPLTERFNRSVSQFDFSAVSPIDTAARAAYAKAPIPEVSVNDFRVRGGLKFAGTGGGPRGFWESDRNNFMPRIGLAYSLRPATVLRTGYGIFFDTVGSKYQAIQSGFSSTTLVVPSLDNGQTFLASLANPFPSGLQPALGPAGGYSTNLGQGVTFHPKKMVNAYAQRWSFGLQHQFLREFVLDASYVGNRGTKLPIRKDYDAIPGKYFSTLPYRDENAVNFLSTVVANPFQGLLPGTSLDGATVSRSILLRPYPAFTSITSYEPQGYSWYHSLQVRGEKRFSRGYMLSAAYTWSKFMEATGYLNSFDAMPERVVSPFDFTHRAVVSGIYEVPFGKGRRFVAGANRIVDSVIGGWQLNAVITRQSGGPLAFGNIIFNGNLKDIPVGRGERSVDRWFNVDAGFERDARKQLANNVRFFPSRLSGVRGDGQHMWDMSAFKNFVIRERLKLQFRAETFNALNHANFSAPNTSPTSSAFGKVSAQNGNPRWWQLSLRLMF